MTLAKTFKPFIIRSFPNSAAASGKTVILLFLLAISLYTLNTLFVSFSSPTGPIFPSVTNVSPASADRKFFFLDSTIDKLNAVPTKIAPALPAKNRLNVETCSRRDGLISGELLQDDKIDTSILVTSGMAPFWINIYPISQDIWISKQISEIGIWHQELTEMIRQELDCIRAADPHRDITFLDAGANIGFFSLFFAQYPRTNVISVEPFPAHFAKFSKSIKVNGARNIEAHNVALSNKPGGSVCLCADAENGGSAMVLSCKDGQNCQQTCDATARCGSVPVSTLDIILAGRAVDVMKIDIEGYETMAFLGANSLFHTSRRPRVLYMEYNFNAMPKNPDPVKVMMDLVSQGYEVTDMHLQRTFKESELVDFFSDLKKYVPSGQTDLVLRLVNPPRESISE
ncbi:hypothetical protein HDV05_004580 [Chytridiales sp. JEL 0842]|nr:hypothetical protein HDV05_004580 [Chytridiales sp. JEL 0842]